jgi:5-methylcytosine-specific restriction endonuclease McrA
MAIGFPKPRPKLLDKRDAARKKLDKWIEVRLVVLARDKGQCRIYGGKATDVHHLLPRSRGGKDEPGNLIAVSRRAHQDIHGHVVTLRWTNEANRAGTLRVEIVK